MISFFLKYCEYEKNDKHFKQHRGSQKTKVPSSVSHTGSTYRRPTKNYKIVRLSFLSSSNMKPLGDRIKSQGPVLFPTPQSIMKINSTQVLLQRNKDCDQSRVHHYQFIFFEEKETLTCHYKKNHNYRSI